MTVRVRIKVRVRVEERVRVRVRVKGAERGPKLIFILFYFYNREEC